MTKLQLPESISCVPILVGVTGHRDIEDEEKLIKDFITALQNLTKRFPATPIVLLTPLAEGADRAAAKAVDRLSLDMDIKYLTILPMDEDEYVKTFSGTASVHEYHALKSKGMGCYQVPIHDSFVIGVEDKGLYHAQLYANMGTFMALHTQVLIAAWNGGEEETDHNCSTSNGAHCISDGARCPHMDVKLGGTYHLLRVRFFGVEDAYRNDESYLSNREFGPVYWIKTKRKSSGYMAGGDCVVGPAYPQFPLNEFNRNENGKCIRLVKDYFPEQKEADSEPDRTFDIILSKLNAYNLDILTKYTPFQATIKASKDEFITAKGDTLSGKLPVEECSMITHYSVSDCLSVYYQDRRKRDVILLILLAFLGLMSFNLYSGPIASYIYILGYSSIYLLGSLFYLFWMKGNRNHEKYVDYRGIAEGLRVQYFWNLVEVPVRVTDVYLNKQKGSVSWIKIAINNICLLSKVEEGRCRLYAPVANLEVVSQLWLQKQQEYYKRKQPQKHYVDTMQKRLEVILFILGLTVAILLTGLDIFEAFTLGTSGIFSPLGTRIDYPRIHQWIVFGVGFLPVIIALFKVFTELMAYSKLARNFKWMRMVYRTGLNEFNRIRCNHNSDPEVLIRKSRKLIWDIGVEALSETEEWIGILDDRVPEMPK